MLAYLKTLKKYPLIALDLGLDELRLLQLKKRGATYHIEKMLIQPLSRTQSRPERKRSWNEVESDLSLLVKRADLRNAAIALALPSSMVLKKQIELPLMVKEAELMDELKQRLYDYFPGDPEENIHFDFRSRPSSEGQSSCILVAARREEFQSQFSAIQKAGLCLRIADVDIYALARAGAWYYFQYHNRQGEAAALLDLSWPLASFLVFNREDLIFHHQWRLELNLFEEPLIETEIWPLQVHTAWQLCQEMYPRLRIAALGLAGEIPKLDQIAGLLRESCPLPLEVLRPFQGMSCSHDVQPETLHSLSSRFLLCCGLALREAE